MKILIDEFIYAGDTTLRCPVCNSDYMHHETIEIFNRAGEDSLTGYHACIDGLDRDIDIDTDTNNPSTRRDGILITFWCEGCEEPNDRHVMSIVQHKGITIFAWES